MRTGAQIELHGVGILVDLEEELVDLGSAAPVVLVGHETNEPVRLILDDLEGAGADHGRLVGVGVGGRLGIDLRPDMRGQDRHGEPEHVRLGTRADEAHRVGVDGDHALDERRVAGERPHVVVDDVVEGEDDVAGRERTPVLPRHPPAQREGPRLAVGRVTPGRRESRLGRQRRGVIASQEVVVEIVDLGRGARLTDEGVERLGVVGPADTQHGRAGGRRAGAGREGGRQRPDEADEQTDNESKRAEARRRSPRPAMMPRLALGVFVTVTEPPPPDQCPRPRSHTSMRPVLHVDVAHRRPARSRAASAVRQLHHADGDVGAKRAGCRRSRSDRGRGLSRPLTRLGTASFTLGRTRAHSDAVGLSLREASSAAAPLLRRCARRPGNDRPRRSSSRKPGCANQVDLLDRSAALGEGNVDRHRRLHGLHRPSAPAQRLGHGVRSDDDRSRKERVGDLHIEALHVVERRGHRRRPELLEEPSAVGRARLLPVRLRRFSGHVCGASPRRWIACVGG